MNAGCGIRIGLNLSEAHLKDAKESLSEDIHTHFARPQFPIDKGNWHLVDAKAQPSGVVFHFDLKGITDETDAIQINGT